jgi:hypothetical protein
MRTNGVGADSGQSGVDRSSAIRDRHWQTQRGASIEELHLAGETRARGRNRDSEGKIVIGGCLLRIGYGQGSMRSNLRTASTASTIAAATSQGKAQHAE